MGQDFSHFDEFGNAIMVDVTDKVLTKREAIAIGSIQVSSIVMEKIKNKTIEKGDVLSVARIAGIMATKRTGDLIPLCHPLMLTNSSIDFELDIEKNIIIRRYTFFENISLTGINTCNKSSSTRYYK